MKAYIEQLLRDTTDPIHGRNLVREYLQARILEGLQSAGAMIHLAFQGGTALHFLYAIPHYSEDLDFVLEKPAVSYDFRVYLRAIQEGFVKEGYQIGITLNDRKTVHSAFLRSLSPKR
jgi:predicted nucleotidyltransferase component of viral defense system